MNPLSQLYINRQLQKYVSVSICHYHRASFMKSLFIAYLEQWVISWLSRLISFYCECVVCFYFCLFSYFCCLMYYLLRYWGRFVNTWLGLLQPLVINLTGLVQFGKIWVTSCLHLPLRIIFCRVSPWNWLYQFLRSNNAYAL